MFQIRKTYEGQRTVYTLIVSRLEPRDSGFYTCSIHIRGSQATSPHKDGEIVVMGKGMIEYNESPDTSAA